MFEASSEASGLHSGQIRLLAYRIIGKDLFHKELMRFKIAGKISPCILL